ncbi:MAG: ketoacyl-ACP synthase III [Fretibacterium sp.]|nr:ketoacyl-ACP synthase III [Fretibacterium sp.]
MITSDFSNLKIAGIAAAVPTKCVRAHDYDELFGEKTVSKNISSAGMEQTYHASEAQTSSDLAYAAAKNLMEKMDIDPSSIGVLIFVAGYLDYQVPPTACVLHSRLGLSTDCMAFDTDLGCSGYVYGLQMLCATLQTSSAKRGLLLTGDITSKVVSPLDKSRLLFGDGGSATLVEKCEAEVPFHFGMKTDGSRFKSIIVPAGAYRNINASRERTEWADGNIRSDYNLFMDGMEVFKFTMTDVPGLATEFMEHYGHSVDDFDSFIFHQPNLFILKHLMKKLNIPEEKMPISLDRYGNTSVCAIPITICDAYHGKSGEKKLFIYGFGVGLSWACASIAIDASHVYPIEHTDDYFKDGSVSHG